jgi:hypothetical protein
MKALPATVCLLLVGCAGIVVTPETKPPLTVECPSEREPRGEVDVVDLLETVELGLRSDGVVVWRNIGNQNE